MANKSKLYIFVKGNQSKYGYEITDFQYNQLHQCVEDNLFEEGKPISPISADILAIEDSLRYIYQNVGSNQIPPNPVINIFTTFELNYDICSNLKQANKSLRRVYSINELKSTLARFPGDRDHVKFFWLPKEFTNRMVVVDKFLNKKIN